MTISAYTEATAQLRYGYYKSSIDGCYCFCPYCRCRITVIQGTGDGTTAIIRGLVAALAYHIGEEH